MNSVNSQTKLAVIVARPGVVLEALRATLAQVSRLEVCGIASGSLSALKLVRKYNPALLVIDSGLLQDEMLMLLKQSKQMYPQIKCLVVTGSQRQQQIFNASEADIVILRSERIDRMEEALGILTES